jgi:hypothetical protein
MDGLRKFFKKSLFKAAILLGCIKNQRVLATFPLRMTNTETNGSSTKNGVIANPLVGNTVSTVVVKEPNGSSPSISLSEQRHSTGEDPFPSTPSQEQE